MTQPEQLIPDFQHQVDAQGLACPLPILKAKKALATMLTGEVLQVLTTDKGAVRDFQAFAKQTGNDLIAQVDQISHYAHYLKRR
jgi:tRNA 2-thiouridine synthesizing protein A